MKVKVSFIKKSFKNFEEDNKYRVCVKNKKKIIFLKLYKNEKL
jgi:hypothetical protein